MNKPEKLIAEKGFYAAAIHGTSMYPMLINHKDAVYVVAPNQLRKKDVLLYRRAGNNQLVLHRLIRHENGALIMCGDNELGFEKITRDQVIGVMREFTHNGKKHTEKNIIYRLYVLLWTTPVPVKRRIIFMYRLPGRVRRKLFGSKRS